MQHRRLSVSAFVALAVKVFGLLLGFAVSALTARLLLPEAFGRFSVAVTTINVLAVSCTLGTPVFILRSVSKHMQDESEPDTSRFLAGYLIKHVVLFVIIGAVIGIGYFYISDLVGVFGLLQTALLLTAGAIFSVAIVLSSFVRARKAIIEAQMLEDLARPGTFLLSFGGLALWLGPNGVSEQTSVFVFAGAGVIVAVLALVRFHKHYGGYPANHPGYSCAGGLLVFGLINVAQVLNANIDILLLGAIGTDVDAGMYRVAFSMAMLISFPLSAANSALGPWYSDFVVRRDRQGLHRLLGWAGLAVSAATITSAILMIVLADFLLGFAFGDAYVAAASVLTMLVVGQIINGLAGPVALLLNLMHDERFVFGTLLVSLGISLTLNVSLIPVYGAVGAAISNAVAIGIWNMVLIGRILVKHSVNSTFTALVLRKG